MITDAVLRGMLRLAAGRRSGARLSILIFHRVHEEPDPLFPNEMHREAFDALCARLSHWFNVLPLDDALARLRRSSLPPAALSITFDDGYADNYDVALPILKRHGFSATFFIATGFLDGGRMFNDSVIEAIRRTHLVTIDAARIGLPDVGVLALPSLAAKTRAIERLLAIVKYLEPARRLEIVRRLADLAAVELPNDLMMTSVQVRALHDQGMQIGAHTRHHPILALLPRAQARDEIEGGKADLEAIVGVPVRFFAYPNGKPHTDYSGESVVLAKAAGFDAALTTSRGAADNRSDPFQIPRFTPWDRRPAMFAMRMAQTVRVARPGLV